MKDLDKVLDEADLHFAMGTAALDGAKKSIPTIVIDASYSDFPDNYKYRWIYETHEPILGTLFKSEQQMPDNKHTINEIVSDLKNHGHSIANKCREYVIANYDIDMITDKLMTYNATADLSFEAFQGMFSTRYFKLLRRIGIK